MSAMPRTRNFRVHLAGPTLGLTLISAGSLAFEISLTRLFAVQQFHHFAFVVVSLAVMGIAASGLLLAARTNHPPLEWLALAYAVSVALAYLMINFLPFDSYSIAWDRKQVGILLLYFISAGIPFLFAGWTVGACLVDAGSEAHRPYAANLIGSALGCPLALLASAFIGGEGAIALSITLGLLAASVFTLRNPLRITLAVLAVAVLFVGVYPPSALNIRISPYKPLSVLRMVPDANITEARWSSSARLDVVESSSIHVYPGLSLNAAVQLPQQAALFIDGDGPLPITALPPDDPTAETLSAHMPATLAYQLRPGAHTFIMSPGAGLEVISALAAGASTVTIGIDEPLIYQVLTNPYADFSYHLFNQPRLRVYPQSGRGALRYGVQNYDIIQFALSDGYRPVTSGAFSLTENFTLTVEAFRTAYDRLTDDGLLVITRWLGTPPSESARAWATLLTALERYGEDDLSTRLVAYRGMRTATIIAGRKPFSPPDLDTVRSFLQSNSFDPIFLPDLDPSELNQYNQLPEDLYHQVYNDLLMDLKSTIDSYEFNLRPPTDDRPFFFHFFRWRQTPEVLATLGLTWQPYGGSGYLVLLALLGLMMVLAVTLALAPVLILGRGSARASPGLPSLGYFAFLGAGYLLVEIPLMQRLSLLLDRPVIALATVLFTLLLASGLGSLFSLRFNLRKSLATLIVLLILTTTLLPNVVQLALTWTLSSRIALTVVILVPAGFLMGVPFASGLRKVQQFSQGSIPWAWAINGAVSGVTGVLAAMIALDLGFTFTLVVGVGAYLGAWITAPSLSGRTL